MPGVLITESLAQAGAIAILSMEENKGKNALFGGIDKMKFKKMVVPGDKLKLEVKIIKRKGPIGIYCFKFTHINNFLFVINYCKC